MGLVINFPDVLRPPRDYGPHETFAEPASVTILPVVRVERPVELAIPEEPRGPSSPKRGRRRPAAQT
jgi:hypothetical protein